MSAAEDTRVELAEETRVFLRRKREAERYGFTRREARLWGESQVDSGELRRLKAQGCPPRVAAKILL